MRVEGLDRLIKEHPFFRDMDAAACETIAGCAANERFNIGDYVFREGGAADKFYLIRQGTIALEIHVPGKDSIIVDTLETGAILGWAWLVPPYRWTYDARAITLCRMVSLDAHCLRGKYETDHTLAKELFKRFIPVMAKRLEATRQRMIEKAQARSGGAGKGG
ncbi:MAG: cyclic nucleotide-binding domain-containing protein [Gammaproteobacteria bacterium]|nr:cyclic nucleotide-binding domain-containing protein [Gammaproteobacteria bacterium]